MSYTEQDVERVAEAIWHEDYFWNTGVYPDHEDENHIPITWDRESKTTQRWGRSVARAALEAMEREPLEDVLLRDGDVTVIAHLLPPQNGHNTRVTVAVKHRDRRRTDRHGAGATIDEAIRNAIAAEKGEKA